MLYARRRQLRASNSIFQLCWPGCSNPSERQQPYDIPCCSRSHPVRHALPLLCAQLASFASFASSASTHTHTIECPFVLSHTKLQLQRTFLFWPQLIYASFFSPLLRLFSDFCHLTFAWLPAVAVVGVVFWFLFERFENFNFEFLSCERTSVHPPPSLSGFPWGAIIKSRRHKMAGKMAPLWSTHVACCLLLIWSSFFYFSLILFSKVLSTFFLTCVQFCN